MAKRFSGPRFPAGRYPLCRIYPPQPLPAAREALTQPAEHMQSIYLYPRLCLVRRHRRQSWQGHRNTLSMFWGSRPFRQGEYQLYPPQRPQSQNASPAKDKSCYGYDLSGLSGLPGAPLGGRITTSAGCWTPIGLFPRQRAPFSFQPFLQQTRRLRTSWQQQVRAGLSETEIRRSWAPGFESLSQAISGKVPDLIPTNP